MPNKNYVKGRKFEYKIKKEYEDKGYLVFRTAGSHSPADLIAFSPFWVYEFNPMPMTNPILIQCKNTKKIYLPGDKEIEQLKNIAEQYGLRAVLVNKSKGKEIVTWIVK
jgi:Holliday junction resolvase